MSGTQIQVNRADMGAMIKEIEMDSHAHSFCDKGTGTELESVLHVYRLKHKNHPLSASEASQIPYRTLPLARFILYIDL